MPPRVSVTLGSNRPGGVDIALAGLVGQTFTDFEVIFVDGRYYQRHAQVMEAVLRSGLKQPFYHVPNHRYGDEIWGTTCAGYNTGFMLAEGEIVVMLLDYAYVPPNWLETHVRHQETPKIIMAPHEYRTLLGAVTKDGAPCVEFFNRPHEDGSFQKQIDAVLQQRERFNEISIFAKPFSVDWLNSFPVEGSDVKCGLPTGVWTDPNHFSTKNESFPLQAILDINGMDENYDRGRGPGDPDLGFRLSQSLEMWIVHEAMVHCLNPRRILPNINIAIPENSRLPPPYQDRWYTKDGDQYFEDVKARRRLRADNPFDIRQRRKDIWHWRELSQAEETVIPKNVCSDGLYFRKPPPAKVRPEGKPLSRTFVEENPMSSPHMFDPRTQLNYIVWHNDVMLEKTIRHVIETVKPDRWVETGSHMGWTSMWVAKNYPDLPILTVELDPEYHVKSRENLAPFPHVTCYQGDSPTFLKNMMPMLQHGTTIFWLDAHWLPPVPLRKECEVVAKLGRYVCLIDDFYCWKPDFPGDLFLSAPGPDGDPTYHNDISYVASALGENYWRSNYPKPPDTKGLGMFIKGVDYQPPIELMKHETLAEFFENRPPIPNPIHPSCPRRPLNTLEYNGRTMVFDGYGKEHIVGGEGPIMADNFHIQPGEVFIDVGAADSSWTLYALASGASLVYCFEPALSWYRKLLQDLMANDGFLERSRVFLNGLHHEDGMKTIREVFTHISGPQTPQTMVPEFYVPIRFLKLDHFLNELPRLDWIKMDIEGGEWYAMEGGAKVIEKFRPNFIIENHNQVPWIGPWMAENKIVEKIRERLSSLGYKNIYEYEHPQTLGRTYIVALR